VVKGHLTECPTCKTPRDEDGRWQTGKYRLDGQEQPCDCSTQVELFQHYVLSGIPDQYMRLDWDRDYYGDPEAQDSVAGYLEKWNGMNRNGIGMEFAGTLGIGKTFAVTALAKELIKRGEDVLFVQFVEVLEAIRYERFDFLEKIKNIRVLILDELVSPPNDKLQTIFADHFEYIIRYRTNNNGVNIMTTNLSAGEIEDKYARVYSLMRAKSISVEMKGKDARRGEAAARNLALAMNDEVRPIS